ncbi:hypothetical protein [Nocardia pseudovaccinii]|uniref:hypothetical protein n=1 Tax=Nocardia pseudovaccinii TaxID=189540 RepID=UPI0007A46D9C|nr:hypothetical protein [Nocardia pseudovaccinii]
MLIAAAGLTLTAASACSSVVDHFSGPYDPGTAKVGDCFSGKHRAIGGGANLTKTVSCGNPEGYYQVSAVLGNGKSAECPADRSREGYLPAGIGRGSYSTNYFEADGKTFCLLWQKPK